MSKGLPAEIDPLALAKRGASYQGTIDIESLPRLKKLVLEDKGQIDVQLRFAKGPYLPPTLVGEIDAQLVLTCQRCGDPMHYTVKVRPELRIVATDDQAKQLPRHEEALVTHGGVVSVKNLVEDEILLSLPMIAKHEEAVCRVQSTYEL